MSATKNRAPQTRTRRTPAPATVRSRAARSDGAATRSRIVEVAGRLFAEHGYADTTSKAICAAARTNIAAVNYHFGSRDGLYMEVLREVHRHVVAFESIAGLVDSTQPAEDKLDRFIDIVCSGMADSQRWQTRLWARELLSPSPLLPKVMENEAMPKFEVLRQILGEALGVPPHAPAVALCALNIMAPFLVLLIASPDLPGPPSIVRKSSLEQIAAHMKTFAHGGLAQVRTAARPAGQARKRQKPTGSPAPRSANKPSTGKPSSTKPRTRR